MTLTHEVAHVFRVLGFSLLGATIGLTLLDGSTHVLHASAATHASDLSFVVPTPPENVHDVVMPLRRDPFEVPSTSKDFSRFDQLDGMVLPANDGAKWMPFTSNVAAGNLHVLAVSVGEHSSALIENGSKIFAVSIGDQITGQKVEKISRSGVLLDGGDLLPVSDGGTP